MTTVPTFGQVATLTHSALSKVRTPTALAPGSIPSNMEMSVQAIRPAPQYTTPHCCGDNPPNPTPQQNNLTCFLLEKASFYQSKPPAELLKVKHGWTCLYCKETGHWYANCKLY
jgi:hypothetical protein